MEQFKRIRQCPICGNSKMETKITYSNIRYKSVRWVCGHCDYVSSGEDIETTSFTPPENKMMPRARIRKDD